MLEIYETILDKLTYDEIRYLIDWLMIALEFEMKDIKINEVKIE